MIKAIGLEEYLTPELQKMFDRKEESIVKSIKLTSIACPEQYECFDEYGNQVAYLRLRHGYFSVECPDCTIINSICVYETEEVLGDGSFYNDEERIFQLENAINSIDNWYDTGLKMIKRIDDGENVKYEIIDPENHDEQSVMEELYYYQQSNFIPSEVMAFRMKGPSLSYREAILKIIKRHRLGRREYFPEANGRDGLSDEHIESELQHIKGMSGHWMLERIIVINELFDKTLDDFEELFREYSKKGWNSL